MSARTTIDAEWLLALEEVAEAAEVLCHWLDYHADDMAAWKPSAYEAAGELLETIGPYERLKYGSE